MKADDIITYCLDNYGYVDYSHTPYGQELKSALEVCKNGGLND